ncbi:MAG: hypothetical protein HYZ47_01225 [Simkania negevensis]|nr:hypothetical protein [Simkania negevensis]
MKKVEILLIKTSSLGDILQTFPVLFFLKEHFKEEVSIDWLSEKPFASLLAAHPLIREVIAIDTRKWRKAPFSSLHWQEFKEVKRRLQEKKYDVVFDLQGNSKSALFTFLSKGKEKVGYSFFSAPEWISSLFLTHRYPVFLSDPISLQLLSLLESHYGVKKAPKVLSVDLKIEEKERGGLEETFRSAFSSCPSSPFFMISLGSRWENKKLSLATWKGILEKLTQEIDPYFFFVWGLEKEKEEVEALALQFPERSLVLPNMELPLWHESMKKMDALLTVDSAALHLGAVACIPTFSFFGPSSAKVYQPIGKEHGSFQGTCPYKEEFEKRCPILRTCETGACMKNLDPLFLAEKVVTWWRAVALQSRSLSPQDGSLH